MKSESTDYGVGRLEATSAQLARQVECARAAGIYDAMFLAFGSLLGHVRHDGIIPGDDDMDVGFDREMITAEQEEEYLRQLAKPTREFPEHGLFEYRREMARRDDDARLFWVSIRGRPASECFKCCHWFFWRQGGYAWHCKGRGTMVKGMPADYLRLGPHIDFIGSKIRIPELTGSVLDLWYTDWFTPRSGGNSSKKITMTVSSWEKMQGSIKESNF